MKVTVAQLTKLNACRDQVDLFIKTFGQEVEVTEASCLIAARAGIDIDWAAQKLLTPKQRQAYKDAKAPLWQAYEDARDQLLQAYKDARAVEFFKASQL